MKKYILFLLLFVSGFAFGQDRHISPYSFKGKFYDSTSFAVGSYTNHGATPSITSNHIQLTGGNQTISATQGTNNSAFNQYITLNAPGGTMLERVKMAVAFTLTSAPGASSAGIAIGTISTNTVGLPCNGMGYYNMTTSTGKGQSYVLTGQLNTTTAKSINAVPVVQNDRYLMIYERIMDSVYVSVKDLTTDTASAFAGYTYEIATTANPLYPNTGLYGIASLGGTVVIDSISISSNEILSPNLLIVGHSKLTGYGAPWNLRIGSLLNLAYPGTVVSAGQSDQSADVILHLAELVAFKPKQVIISINRNDLFAGTATATWERNDIIIDSTLTANGASVYWLDELYETSLTTLGLVTHFVDSAFSGRVIHTWFPGNQLGSVAVVADGVHPSQTYQYLAANIIQASGFIKNYALFTNDAFRYVPAYSFARNLFTKQNNYLADIVIGTIPSGGSATNYQMNFGNGNTQVQNTIFIGSAGLGSSALSGTGNICIGVSNGHGLIAGTLNTSIGNGALFADASGGNNAVLGANACSNCTSSFNTAVGSAALQGSNTGGLNTAVGYNTLNVNTSGARNFAGGEAALITNSSGSDNMGIGARALGANTTTSSNTAIGASAGDSTTQSASIYIGFAAGFKNSKDNRLFINNQNSFLLPNLVYGDLSKQKLQIDAPANPLVIPAQLTIGYSGGVMSDSLRGTHGIGFSIPSQQYADLSTAASGTVTDVAIHSVEGDSISVLNSTVTYTNLYGLLFGADPVATANAGSGNTPTVTNKYSVGFQGKTRFLGEARMEAAHSVAYRAITAIRTLDATDYFVNCTANSFTVTLPTAVGITGREYIIKNTGTATTITIATTSAQTIDGSAPGTITTLVPLRVISDGANWETF